MIKMVTNMNGKSKKTVTLCAIFNNPLGRTLCLEPQPSERAALAPQHWFS
jgi:hypothetical protein